MALTAIPVGFVAGLFGIGGGLITVPFLYFIFGSLEIDPQYVMHLACLLYTSPSPRDLRASRMPSSA